MDNESIDLGLDDNSNLGLEEDSTGSLDLGLEPVGIDKVSEDYSPKVNRDESIISKALKRRVGSGATGSFDDTGATGEWGVAGGIKSWEPVEPTDEVPYSKRKEKGTDSPEYTMHSTSMFDKVIKAIDYIDNVGRGAELGLLRDDQNVIDNVVNAATLRKHFPASEIRKYLQENHMMPANKDWRGLGIDPNSTWGINLWSDIAIDIAASPTTWIPVVGPLIASKKFIKGSKAIKASKGIKGAGNLIEKVSSISRSSKKALGIKKSDEVFDIISKAKRAKDSKTAIKDVATKLGLSTEGAKAIKTLPEQVLKDASSYMSTSATIKHGLGGLYGYAMSNPDDPFVKKLGYGILGATTMYGARKTLPHIARGIKGGGDALIDKYYKWTRNIDEGKTLVPEKEIKSVVAKEARELFPIKSTDSPTNVLIQKNNIEKYIKKRVDSYRIPFKASKAYEMLPDITTKLSARTAKIVNSYRGVVNKLSAGDQVLLRKSMDYLKRKTVKLRNEMLKEEVPKELYDKFMKTGHLDNVYEVAVDKSGVVLQPYEKEIFNQITKEANEKISSQVPKELISKQHIIPAVREFQKHNRRVVKMYNDITNRGLIGLDFHIDDSFLRSEFGQIDELVNSLTGNISSLKVNRAHGYLDNGALKNPRNIPKHYLHSDPARARKVMEIDQKLQKSIDEINKTSGINKAKKANDILKLEEIADKEARKVWAGIELTPEALKKSYEEYASVMALTTLNQKEKQALQIIRHIKNSSPFAFKGLGPSKKAEMWEKALDTYDSVHNHIKGNMLGLSTSWIKLNFFDNLQKAYQSMGLLNATKVGARQITGLIPEKFIPDWIDPLGRNISKILDPKNQKVWKDTKIFDASLRHGVLEKGLWDIHNSTKNVLDDIINRSTLKKDYLLNPEKFEKNAKGIIARGYDKLDKYSGAAFMKDKVFSIGKYMEGSARMTTFDSAVKGFMKDGTYEYVLEHMYKGKDAAYRAQEHIYSMAADLVKETFFDYGNISKFEQAFAKRMIPFYAFASKNLPYWLKEMSSIKGNLRLATTSKFMGKQGRTVTEKEYASLPEYLKSSRPRVMGRTVSGDYIINTNPFSSFVEAIDMIDPSWDNIKRQVISRLSPLVKAPIELIYGWDAFTDGRLLPSERTAFESTAIQLAGKASIGKKYLFSRGFKYVALDRLAEKMGIDLGIEIDKRGNPVATKDNIVMIDKLFSTLYPTPVIDQIVGSLGKVANLRETSGEAIQQYFTPTKTTKVSKKSMRYNWKKHKDLNKRLKKLRKQKREIKEDPLNLGNVNNKKRKIAGELKRRNR